MSTSLRQFINATLREVAASVSAVSVLNAGATRGAHDREGRLYRDYFPSCPWTTLDRRAGADIRVDLADVPDCVPERFDLVLCMSVLEHVEHPERVADGLRRLLSPGGSIFVAVPFLYPYHPAKDFGDFWRFTADGLRLLFHGMTEIFLEAAPDEAGYCALYKEATP